MEASIGSKSDDQQDMIFSSLPKQTGLNVFNNKLVKYQGFWYPDMSMVARTVSAQQNFQAQPNDVFLCSAPKTGTTWLKALAFAIISRRRSTISPLLYKFPHECLPALEFIEETSITHFDRDPTNPLIATHIPFSSLPKSVSIVGCKMVYICRDPKDTFVSMYHFFAKVATSRNIQPVPLHKAFKFFCNGESSFGPYWDHVLGYWKASLDFPDKILFLKYEEMKEDANLYAKKLAEFIGHRFRHEEEVEKIVRMCSFENLSRLEVNQNGKVAEKTQWEIQNKLYFRKGRVHDWKNYLTPEMAIHLDSITEQKLSGSGLNLIYPIPHK